jgi:hypothetical protein
MKRVVIVSAAAIASVMIGLAAGCSGTVVEPDPVPADYTDWYRVDSTGTVPGHGDSYRIIYVNEAGTTPDVGRTAYLNGTVIVKEIYERNGDEPGDLQYIGVMRKLTSAPDGGELQGTPTGEGAWLFTYLADGIDSDEENRLSCWEECHRAAPFDNAFLDYRQ